MKIAMIGPAEGDVTSLDRAVRRLLDEWQCDRVFYLGTDDLIDDVVDAWHAELGDEPRDSALARVATLGASGTAAQIHAYLAGRDQRAALSAIVRVPDPPARTVELLDDRLITLVFDKATLTEDDIANSAVLAYGKSSEPFVRQIGPRYFLTPGPVARGVFGIAELSPSGEPQLGLHSLDGKTLWRDTVQGQRAARMRVG